MSVVAVYCLGATSIATMIYLLIDGGPVTRGWHRYTKIIENYFGLLFIDASASRAAGLHMAGCAVMLVAGLLLSSVTMLLLVPPLAVLPAMILDGKKRKKQEAISEQLAPWLTVLANSLKSSPNITDAFASSIGLVPSPLREELDLLVKEVRLGEHLDRAMHTSAKRIDSPLYSSVITTLLVGRTSGGNLPKILDDSSDTLREMERLAGVVRSKTAEGRAQTFVLALMPFVLILALHKVSPDMLPGLARHGMGQILICISIVLWVSSVALALKIVKVDI